MAAQAERQEIQFWPNPTQKLFIESRAEADLFDSRKGEGKSTALCWACMYHTQHNPGAHWLILRDTWENLRRTTLQEFFAWFRGLGEWRAGDKEFIWHENTGIRGRVQFMGADDESAASKIASMPLGGFAIDEPSPADADSVGVSELVFDTALAQLRQPGMKWYAAKLAQNNPDESHWTYRRFWDPGTPPDHDMALPPLQEPGFKAWQTEQPENLRNLPAGYYERMARTWAHRPDLLRRFVEGRHGYQQAGQAVTPEWDDDVHLTSGLEPVRDCELQILWDGWQSPACVITQVTPLGDWLVLEAHTGSGIGVAELIEEVVRTRLTTRFAGFKWRHIGDPSMKVGDQSSIHNSAALLIQRELGGPFIGGPVKPEAGIEPLRNVLRRQRKQGALGVYQGIVRVDREHAKAVWYALRGGWHYNVTRGGITGDVVKDQHSHPGDAMRYGAGVLFPLGKLQETGRVGKIQSASYFRGLPGQSRGGLGFERPGLRLPKHGERIG